MGRMRAEVIYENTLPAEFVCRVSRFTAEVSIDGVSVLAHVKNTGRLKELLVPGARVTLQRVTAPGRKTDYDLISVYRPRFKWINIDSQVPNALIRQVLTWAHPTGVVLPEYVYGDSRLDFCVEQGETRYLTEVKGCTLADDFRSGIGFFPDAPSDRAVRHLQELKRAAAEGYLCGIDFVIQMNGIHLVMPNDVMQPAFGAALREAAEAGVQVVCHSCHVEADSIRITGTTQTTQYFVR